MIGGKEVYIYYVDGFVKSEIMERIFSVFLQLPNMKWNSKVMQKNL